MFKGFALAAIKKNSDSQEKSGNLGSVNNTLVICANPLKCMHNQILSTRNFPLHKYWRNSDCGSFVYKPIFWFSCVVIHFRLGRWSLHGHPCLLSPPLPQASAAGQEFQCQGQVWSRWIIRAQIIFNHWCRACFVAWLTIQVPVPFRSLRVCYVMWTCKHWCGGKSSY